LIGATSAPVRRIDATNRPSISFIENESNFFGYKEQAEIDRTNSKKSLYDFRHDLIFSKNKKYEDEIYA